MRSPLSYPSKVILTGGTSGIGAQILDLLLDDGHHVIVLARTADLLAPRTRMEAVSVDLSDPRAVKQVMADIVSHHSDVAILINNAALQYPIAMTDPNFDPEMMEAEVAINLLAPALITHSLLPSLKTQGPGAAIVNISSGLAYFPKQQSALYCATKAAIHSFSQSLRYQLDADGVAVVEAILPLVETPMTAGRGAGKISARDAAHAIINGIKAGRAEVFVGKAKLIPMIVRLAPSIGKKMLRGA